MQYHDYFVFNLIFHLVNHLVNIGGEVYETNSFGISSRNVLFLNNNEQFITAKNRIKPSMPKTLK